MNDMNTIQKIQKDKIFNEKLILQWQTKQWPNAFFQGQGS